MHPKSEDPTKPDAPKVIPSATPAEEPTPDDLPGLPPRVDPEPTPDELPSLPPR
jgi:hypothetical protein